MSAPAAPLAGDPQKRPEPDAAGKPTKLREITRPSWRYAFRRSVREFMRDECPDLAAGLTYYGVLAVLPGLIALISLLGILGQGGSSITLILDVARRLMPTAGVDIIRPVLESITRNPSAPLGLALGLLGALWFVSGYVAAFGRALNRIYRIREGRPIWKLQPIMVLITMLLGALCACAILLLVISGSVAAAIGEALGLGSAGVLFWRLAKWPVLGAIVVVVVALLYYFTPNIRQPRFRWLSPGALVAILMWLGGSSLFGLYVSNLSRFDVTYGSLAGVIVFLIWLWVSNIALLLGAELDAEIERARELQAGMAAEHDVQLPPRDTRATDKEEAKITDDVAAGRQIRRRHSDPS